MGINYSRRLLLLGITSVVVASSISVSQAEEVISAKSLREAGGKLELNLAKLGLVQLDLRKLDTNAVTLVSGSKRILLKKWLKLTKTPKSTKHLLLAHRAESFPNLAKDQVNKINQLKNYESTSWVSEEHWYGCTEYSYWCRTRG